MGLAAAVELLDRAARLELDIRVVVYEPEAAGGGSSPWATSPRCQAWLHSGGLHAHTQPQVALAVARSARRLRTLVADAFRFPLAVALQREPSLPPLPEVLAPLGIPCRELPRAVVASWIPGLRLADASRCYRVADGVMHVRLLGAGLARRRAAVSGLERDGERIVAPVLGDGERAPVLPGDAVILAAGSRIRRLLAGAGLAIEGLRLFESHLIASDRPGISALVYEVAGGGNSVPHPMPDGRLFDLFGEGRRLELPPDADGLSLQADPEMVEALRRDAEALWGVELPPDEILAWPAVKTEIAPPNGRNQSAHARCIPGVDNGWIALPGKLTQTAACAADLARLILREQLEPAVARPVWERLERVEAGERSGR